MKATTSASCSMARLAKVGENRSLVGPQLRRPGELRDADHRQFQLAGEDLQAAADWPTCSTRLTRGPRLASAACSRRSPAPGLPRLAARRRALARSSSRLRSEESSSHSGAFSSSLQARTTRGQSRADTFPLRRRSLGIRAWQPMNRCASSASDISSEKKATGSRLGGDVLGDVADERRLSERRPRRQHDQVSRLESAQQVVQIAEAGWRPGDVPVALGQSLQAVDLLRQAPRPRAESHWRAPREQP